MAVERWRTVARFELDLITARINRRLRPRRQPRAAPPLIINSLPKAGTNLLIKAVTSLPHATHIHASLTRDAASRFLPRPGEATIELGVDGPRRASLAKVSAMLRRLPPGAFLNAHLNYQPELARVFPQLGARMLTMVRDPRDVVISSAEYLASRRSHHLFAQFHALPPDERIKQAMLGVANQDPSLALRDIRTRVEGVIRWADEEFAELIRFEWLVGTEGGGSREEQRAELRRLAAHAGADLNSAQVENMAGRLFGGTHTFRHGQIGRWRTVFSSEHAAMASDLLGDLLIRLGYEPDDRWAQDLRR